MNLSTLSIVLGAVALGGGVYGLLKSSSAIRFTREFPRSLPIGWLFMGISTIWFLYNFKNENIADFESVKSYMLMGFLIIGLGAMIYVRDFLAVRGLAVFVMLLAHTMVESARWAETPWRLVIIVLAYTYVLCGIVWTIQPYRLRDWFLWASASPKRFQSLVFGRLAFGVLLIVLGLTAYRGQ